MNAIVADATAKRADLAYDVYADTLDDLRSFHRVDLDLIETVERAAFSTGGFEAEALSYALCVTSPARPLAHARTSAARCRTAGRPRGYPTAERDTV